MLVQYFLVGTWLRQEAVITEAHQTAFCGDDAGVPETCCNSLASAAFFELFWDGALAVIVVAEAMELAWTKPA